jgi:hypothetical protein
MMTEDFERRAATGEPFSARQAAQVLASPDLTAVGHLAELARRHASGDVVTFCRVLTISKREVPASIDDVGEVRLAVSPRSTEEALTTVTDARRVASHLPVTGFSADHLFALCGRDLGALRASSSALAGAGLDALAEFPLDAFADSREAVAVAEALTSGGLGVWRLTVNRAPIEIRVALIERAVEVAAATADVRAFAPLPRQDPADQPATGYDDVRSVAIARLMCAAIPFIQVDWPLYGPKLAQVALMYGANDVDGVAPIDTLGLGARRSPLEEIRRQIKAAAGEPVERNGRYERLS